MRSDSYHLLPLCINRSTTKKFPIEALLKMIYSKTRISAHRISAQPGYVHTFSMPQTFALCFVHDLNPDKCTPDKCTTRISAHVLQAPCATFVCNCTRISAQRGSPFKCHSKSCAYTIGCVTKQYQRQSKRLSIYTVSANCYTSERKRPCLYPYDISIVIRGILAKKLGQELCT
jgi:hypothetical protein